MTQKIRKFTITGDHLLLMKRFSVGWSDTEFGAPRINPKKPYGNSDVYRDMLKILDWDISVSINGGPSESLDCDYELTETLEETLYKLHEELETALQICLTTGSFEPGTYQADEYKDNWRKCNGEEN